MPPSIHGYHAFLDSLSSAAQQLSLLLRYGIEAIGTARPSNGMSKQIREIKKVEQPRIYDQCTEDAVPWPHGQAFGPLGVVVRG